MSRDDQRAGVIRHAAKTPLALKGESELAPRPLRPGLRKRYAAAVPTYTKDLVCLANSRKPPSGRCVAGRVYTNGVAGKWIRPVSDRSGLEISEEERRFNDGSQVAVLDVVRIEFTKPQPQRHQTENHVIDDGVYWSKVGECTFKDLVPLVETPPSLWLDGHSTFHGRNDQVPEGTPGLGDSLVLVRPDKVELAVVDESQYAGGTRRRLRAAFKVGNSDYDLIVTHPEVEQAYFAQGVGAYDVSGSILCVSLADFFNGNASKLVASVITP